MYIRQSKENMVLSILWQTVTISVIIYKILDKEVNEQKFDLENEGQVEGE